MPAGRNNVAGWHTGINLAILFQDEIYRRDVMTIQEQIDQFLSAAAFGVVGASSNRQKFGNRVLRCYQQNGKKAIPVNPNEVEIEGIACVKSVEKLPPEVKSISMITPPAVTEQLVPQAIAHGIENIWMQTGAESPLAVAFCRDKGINVIADGSCLLVVLGYHEH
jgi:predicted CoA-binding protein